MAYRALVSFAGIVTMGAGEVADLEDDEVIEDLLKAGYIEKVEAEKAPKKAVRSRESK